MVLPLEQKQPDDKYDIAQNTGTISVEQKQPYDKYDIAQNTGTIHVPQEQFYERRKCPHCTIISNVY
jgi:glutaredoxin